MLFLLRILLEDPPGQITSAAWKIMGAMAAVIVGLGGYIVKLYADHAAEVKKLYEERITELKSQNDLVETLLNVIEQERRKGGRSVRH